MNWPYNCFSDLYARTAKMLIVLLEGKHLKGQVSSL